MKRVRGQVAEILALDSVKNENENVSNHDHHVPLSEGSASIQEVRASGKEGEEEEEAEEEE
jgi:hypothetical protein